MVDDLRRMKRGGRLAFRHEGRTWRAYWALPLTMQSAVYLGELPMALAVFPDVKAGFIALIERGVTRLFQERGIAVQFPHRPHPAPEHERSGHG